VWILEVDIYIKYKKKKEKEFMPAERCAALLIMRRSVGKKSKWTSFFLSSFF
jgi:hypothetical protein